jgi:uncharacterized damage-inducible protein DinB
MDAGDVRVLLDYHYWARDRAMDAVEQLSAEQFTRAMGSSFASVRDTVVHVYSAECIWYSRWRGESPAAVLAPEMFPDAASIRTAWVDHEAKVRRFFDSLDRDGVERVIEYRTIAGKPMASALWQMVRHVVNHASYHRGQVTTMLRQLGAAPPKSTDLIAFYRDRDAMAPPKAGV